MEFIPQQKAQQVGTRLSCMNSVFSLHVGSAPLHFGSHDESKQQLVQSARLLLLLLLGAARYFLALRLRRLLRESDGEGTMHYSFFFAMTTQVLSFNFTIKE